MNKYFKLTLIIASISIISCNSGSKNSENSGNSNSTELNKNLLTSEKFLSESGMHSSSIKFFDDDKYTHEMSSEGMGWYNEGTYEIKDNKVILHCTKCAESKGAEESDCFKTLGEAECFIVEDLNSFYYSKKLVCKSYGGKWMDTVTIKVEFPLMTSKVKADEKRTIDNVPALTTGITNATIIETANLKKSPNETSENIEYYEEMYEEAKSMIPANINVKVLAKTEEKAKINGVEDYWYYIEANYFTQNAWIFGKSLKF